MEVARTNLQRVLARETLIAVPARERLDRQMDPLMPLEVMVAVEALRTLIAAERAVVLRARLRRVVSVQLLHVRGVPAVEASGHHAVVHADHLEVAVGVVDVGEHWPGQRIGVWSAVGLRVCLEGRHWPRAVHGGEFDGSACAVRALLHG